MVNLAHEVIVISLVTGLKGFNSAERRSNRDFKGLEEVMELISVRAALNECRMVCLERNWREIEDHIEVNRSCSYIQKCGIFNH